MIDAARKENKPILIHCTQGESRSVTVLIAYMWERMGLNYDQALDYIKSKRFHAGPNQAFENWLKEIQHLGLKFEDGSALAHIKQKLDAAKVKPAATESKRSK